MIHRRLLVAGLFWVMALLAVGASADERVERRWTRTGTLDAPEAVQAAAADDKFVYAVTNDRVAKYDRATGRRLAVSTGHARHLNSGFLWQGKLYCAHSNYPRTPEQSEIMVLDPETMQLSTFKKFGNFGGSLTWAVYRDEHWWCNFARYGKDNAQTFLVKFDEAWQEQGRWTYPPEVLREIGSYSLSGGVWLDESLLVTGHDHPILYQLKAPAKGNVLEFVTKQSVPFTGQGIAIDSKADGLVGIHRGKKQVVFAGGSDRAAFRLRVLTYNIHHGEGVDGKLDLERIAGVINAVEPDLVALQEVDQKTERTGKVDQPAELARLTKMNAAFGGNLRYQGGDYGNMVLSRFPIKQQRNHKLPSFDEGEPRGVLEVEVELPDQAGAITFLSTHFDHRPPDQERIASAKTILELTLQPLAILAGDLNDLPESKTLAALGKTWKSPSEKPLPTIPVPTPKRQIDYVLFKPADRWKVVEARVLEEAIASDHRPLLVVLESPTP